MQDAHLIHSHAPAPQQPACCVHQRRVMRNCFDSTAAMPRIEELQVAYVWRATRWHPKTGLLTDDASTAGNLGGALLCCDSIQARIVTKREWRQPVAQLHMAVPLKLHLAPVTYGRMKFESNSHACTPLAISLQSNASVHHQQVHLHRCKVKALAATEWNKSD